MSVGMAGTIIPKSDQMNADDLIVGSRTITITRVDITLGAEQPVKVYYKEGEGEKKPWLPCKGQRRLLVILWGDDETVYVGRRLTLFRDPDALWAGKKVGGVRISHASHIDEEVIASISESRKSRKLVLVLPLVNATATTTKPSSAPLPAIDVGTIIAAYNTCDVAGFDTLEKDRAAYWRGLSTEQQKLIKQAVESAKSALSDGLQT